ncbi:hypothetical protein ABT294_15130 [Nonomuraea sp. NPDC000554]|uniref:hypothetical protein n=1 Tax=Nonomuraea sp. NPDC000554 TaxID=3154259 RepID=UPI00332C1114
MEFRELFPALRSTVWLDRPGARPVVEAMRDTLTAWSSGAFDWLDWDAAAEEARGLFARLTGVGPETVSTVGSLAEAAATVAASMPPGRIVAPGEEFRSNLFRGRPGTRWSPCRRATARPGWRTWSERSTSASACWR